MAYDEGLATRLRDLVSAEPGLTEKNMFGGLAMLLQGNIAVGVHGDAVIAGRPHGLRMDASLPTDLDNERYPQTILTRPSRA